MHTLSFYMILSGELKVKIHWEPNLFEEGLQVKCTHDIGRRGRSKRRDRTANIRCWRDTMKMGVSIIYKLQILQ